MSDYSPNSRAPRSGDGAWGNRRRNLPPPVSTSPHESDLEEASLQSNFDPSLQSVSPMSGEMESLEPGAGPQAFYPIPVFPDYSSGFYSYHPVMFPQMAPGLMYPPFFAQPPMHSDAPSLSEAESSRPDELPAAPQPPPAVKPPSAKRVIAIKDPKTGLTLDLSDLPSRRASTPKPSEADQDQDQTPAHKPAVEEQSQSEPVEAPLQSQPVDQAEVGTAQEPAQPEVEAAAAAAAEAATAAVPKQLKGIKNKPLDASLFFAKTQTAAYLRMLARRIYNKPLTRPCTPSTSTSVSDVYVPIPVTTPSVAPSAPSPSRPSAAKKSAVEQPAPAAAAAAAAAAATATAAATVTKQLQFPLSRSTLLGLLPRERPAPPASLASLQVVRGSGAGGKTGSGARGSQLDKRGSQQQQQAGATSQWRSGSRGKAAGGRGGGGRGGGGGGGRGEASGQLYEKLKMSEAGYRVLTAQELSEQEQLRRQVQSLLNKITPDSFGAITEKIASIPVANAQSMDTIVSLVFDKAVAEHAYCEMYANMCKTLKDRWPELEVEVAVEGEGEGEGETTFVMQKVTFVRCLIEKCQVEFDAIPQTLAATEEERAKTNNNSDELDMLRGKKKERILGNMKFIAQLYMRNLLSTKVVKSVVDQLMGVNQEIITAAAAAAADEQQPEFPEEHYLECVCLVLSNIGMYLEQHQKGPDYMDAFFDRLKDLQCSGHYSKRIVYLILNLTDARRSNWRGTISSAKLQTVVKKEEARRIPAVQPQSQQPSISTNLPSRFSSQAPPVVASRPVSRASSGRNLAGAATTTTTTTASASSRVSPTGKTAGQDSSSARRTPAAAAPAAASRPASRTVPQPESLASSSSSDTGDEGERSLPSLERQASRSQSPSAEKQDADIKRFRDYYAEDGEVKDFLQAVETTPSHVVARALFALGAQGDGRKLAKDAKLIAEILREGKISIAEVESCYSQFMAEIEDTMVDAPRAVQFHSSLVQELAQIEPTSVAERLLIPAFSQAMDTHTAEKLLGDMLQSHGQGASSSCSKLLEALRQKKTETVAKLITRTVFPASGETSEEESGAAAPPVEVAPTPTLSETTVVEDALKSEGVDPTGQAVELVKKFSSCDRWTLGRLEKIFVARKTSAWQRVQWDEKLAPIKELFAELLTGGGGGEGERSGEMRLALLTRAFMKNGLRAVDVETVAQTCVDWQLLTVQDVEKFARNTDDDAHQAERKFSEEGLNKALASLGRRAQSQQAQSQQTPATPPQTSGGRGGGGGGGRGSGGSRA